MNENKIDGRRAYEFTASFPYIRESGTEGEKRASSEIMHYLHEAGIEGTVEPFTYQKICTVKSEFYVTSPYKKSYPVTFMTAEEPFSLNLEAPFLYVENGDEISLSHAAGKIVLVNEPLQTETLNRIKKSGALAFFSICGTPLDEGTDLVPAERRMQLPEDAILPGARIHLKDAWELVEQGAETVKITLVQEWNEIASQNIVVRIPGKKYPEEIMTLTAHYDSVPAGPGAYDNMSGCAIIMELCRYFSEYKPDRTLEFIWFGSEEKGLRGSIAYVKRHEEELDRHRFHMNVDLAGQMIGGNVAGITAGKEVCDFVLKTAREADRGLEIKNMVWSSDSNTFAWKGIPAMTLNRDGFGMHTRYDTIAFISPWSLKRSAVILGWIAEACDKAVPFPFDRKVPEEFLDKLQPFFENIFSGV